MSTGFKDQNFQILHKITEQQLDPEEKIFVNWKN